MKQIPQGKSTSNGNGSATIASNDFGVWLTAFRAAIEAATKRAAKSKEHAHHIIPRSLEDLFNQKISDPNLSIWDASLGAWWDSGAGYSAAHRQYTAEVQDFLLGFGDGQLSTADLMNYVAELRKRYGF